MADFDVAIIGSGSGNALIGRQFDDRRVALVEDAVFGGTCLNVGCIPTKMYVYAAEIARTVRKAERYGIDATLDRVRWADIRNRIYGRIDPISAEGARYRSESSHVTLFRDRARFSGPRTIELSSGTQFTADQIVIATGAHPVIPDVVADSGVRYETSDSLVRSEQLPSHLIVLGGGYIAAELAGVFSAFGSAITVVTRGSRLLGALDHELADTFTGLAQQDWDVRLGVTVRRAVHDGDSVRLALSDGSEVTGDRLLVAAGRAPNTAGLCAELAGVDLTADGRVQVDAYGRTSAEGIWALGDVSSKYQLKHVANSEARTVSHNLRHPDDLRPYDHRFVPSAVFASPQLASVGHTEQQAREQGVDYVCARQRYADTAYGWAMEDTDGYCKLIGDRATGKLIGAHILGQDASILLQPLIQAMTFDQPLADLGHGQYWIHPALTEVVENAVLHLVDGLSDRAT